jgi:hypothetical protein
LYALNALDPEDLDDTDADGGGIDPVVETGGGGIDPVDETGGGVGGNSATHDAGCCSF